MPGVLVDLVLHDDLRLCKSKTTCSAEGIYGVRQELRLDSPRQTSDLEYGD